MDIVDKTIMEELKSTWVDMSEDHQIVQELLDNASPVFLIPQESSTDSNSPAPSNIDPAIINQLSSAVMAEKEIALPARNYANIADELSQSRIQMVERGLSKDHEHKYTLRIKCSDHNAMADDGYKWRKYGQKLIKNSSYPRSYYRCSSARCGAKKQVERCSEDPDTLIISYEGLHLHYVFPFLASYEHSPNQADPPPKKFKKSISEEREHVRANMGHLEQGMDSQGLLEDVVPLTIRRPLINATTNSSSNSSSSCYPSTPSSPSIFSWSPMQCSPLGFDVSMYE